MEQRLPDTWRGSDRRSPLGSRRRRRGCSCSRGHRLEGDAEPQQRLLHHKDPHDPLTHDESVKAAWVALAAAVAAPVLWALQSAFGLSSPWVWMATSVVLLAVAAGLVVESIGDLVRRHMHIALDVLRLLILAPLVFAVVTSLAQPAQPGSGTEIGVWLVGGTAYMLLVALLAFGLDEIASWRTRSKQAQCHLSPSV